jgi:hypothetical protein
MRLPPCIREIVTTGTLGKLEKLHMGASPELAGMSRFPLAMMHGLATKLQ